MTLIRDIAEVTAQPKNKFEFSGTCHSHDPFKIEFDANGSFRYMPSDGLHKLSALQSPNQQILSDFQNASRVSQPVRWDTTKYPL